MESEYNDILLKQYYYCAMVLLIYAFFCILWVCWTSDELRERLSVGIIRIDNDILCLGFATHFSPSTKDKDDAPEEPHWY